MSVNINPGDNWQNKINAAPSGETFIIKAGTHNNAKSLSPKASQKFIGEVDGAGNPLPVIDGEFTRNAQFMKGPANGIQIKNLVCRNFVLEQHTRAIISPTDGGGGTDWLIENCEFFDIIGRAVRAWTRTTIRNCRAHDMYLTFGSSQANASFVPGGDGRAQDPVIEDSKWWNINIGNSTLEPLIQDIIDRQVGGWQDWVKFNGLWTSRNGCQKFTYTDRAIIRRCEIWNSHGSGIWQDIYNDAYEIYENYIHDMQVGSKGIFIEISFAGVVRNNIIERIGDPTNSNPSSSRQIGILNTSSKGMECHSNTIRECNKGIGVHLDSSRSGHWSRGAILEDFNCHHNTVERCNRLTHTGGDLGDTYLTDPSKNIDFDFNVYRTIEGSNFAGYTWAQWQAIPQDPNGQLNPTAPPVNRSGSSLIGVAFGVSAKGKKKGKGSSSVSVGLAVESHGHGAVEAPSGNSNVNVLFETTANGTPAKKGSSSIGVAFNLTSMGHEVPDPAPPFGRSEIGVVFGITSRGKKRGKGNTLIPVGFDVLVEGAEVSRGESQLDVAFALTASGTKGAHSPRDDVGDPIPIEIEVLFGVDASGGTAGPNPNRNGSAVIGVEFDILPFGNAEDDEPEPPGGTPAKNGSASIPVSFTLASSGDGATSGGSGGPPPPPGGQTAAILPEEYRTIESRMAQEEFS